MQHFRLAALLTIAATLIPLSGQAYFVCEVEQPVAQQAEKTPSDELVAPTAAPVSPPAFPQYRYVVSQVGSGQPTPREGFGRDLTLRDSLLMIMPTGWSYRSEPDVDLATTVSWQGGDSWLTVLEQVGRKSQTQFLVDWNQKRVFLRPLSVGLEDGWAPPANVDTDKTAAPPAVAVIDEPMPDDEAAAGSTPLFTKVQSKPRVLEPGSLKSQLSEWAAGEGWQLVWQAPFDFTVGVRAEFRSADLLDAVRTLVEQLAQGDGTRLRVLAYESNRVLVVKGE